MQEMQEMQVRSPCWDDPLEKEIATHYSTLAWEILARRTLVGYSPRGHKELDTTEATEHTCQEPLPILFAFTLALIWQGRCYFSHLLLEDTSHLVKYFESKLKSQAQSTKCARSQLIPLDHFYINCCQVNFFSSYQA